MTDPDEDARQIATACRVLAHQGLAEDILGHVSLRRDGTTFAVRCRGPRERGLLFTEPADVHTLGLDDVPDLPGGYAPPNELPIHREVLRARPDVRAVVHVHPPAVVASDLAGTPLRPVVGAYNIPAMRLALDGIPVYPRAVLINRRELGKDVAAALGHHQVCLLRGHGIVAVGATTEQAVVRALNLESLARISMAAARPGRPVPELADDEIAELPDLGAGFNDQLVFRSAVAKLEHAGLAV